MISQQESFDVVTLRATSERGVLTDGPSEIDVLQESLETYRTKYKQEKECKKEWKRVRLFLSFESASTNVPQSFQESKKRASEVEAQNKELVRKSKSREPSVNVRPLSWSYPSSPLNLLRAQMTHG